ncbi:Ig-like domain-containing protein, partial [Chloroflexota bacterium]
WATSTYTTAPLAEGTYYWRARAVEAAGAERNGAWAAAFSFTIDTTAPDAPVLLLPGDGRLSADIATLDWSDVTDPSGVTYDVQVDDTDDTFGSLVEDETGLATSTYTTASLPNDTYHWRARAVDGVGNVGDWTSAWTFQVAMGVIAWQLDIVAAGQTVNSTGHAGVAVDASADDDVRDAYDAPVPPMGPSPAIQVYFDHPAEDFSNDIRLPSDLLSWDIDIEATFTGELITLTWDVSAVPAYYDVVQLTMWTLNLGTGAWENPTVVVADMRTTAEYAYTNGFIIAHDRFSIGVLVNQPPEAIVTYPNGGEIVEGTIAVTADAADADGTITQVAFEYSDDAGTTWTAIGAPDTTAPYSASWDTTAVVDGDQYLVRATATDDLGSIGVDVSDATFTVDNTAPAAPTLQSPADGSFTNDNTPALDWSDVADLSGVTYDVQVDDTGATFGSLVVDESGLVASTHTTAALADGIYHWRARAVEAAGAGRTGAWSAVWTLHVDTTAPAAPALQLPAYGSYINDTTPTLDWDDVTDATGVTYNVQLDNMDDTFGSLLVDETGLGDSFFDVISVLAEGTYYWRAMAVDGATNAGAWSAVGTFTVDTTAPPVPTLVSPTDAETVASYYPEFEWTTVGDLIDSGVVTYDLQVDADIGFGSPAIDDTGITGNTHTSLDALVDGDFYWRVRAVDGAGNTGAWAAPWAFTVEGIITVDTTLVTGWHMFSIPVDATLVANSYADILGDNIPTLYIYWYNPSTGGYVTWAAGPPPSYNSEMGKGIWLRVYEETLVDAEGYPALNEPFAIHLLPGWNMIGQPFNFSVDWGDVLVYNTETEETLGIVEAHGANWVLWFLYGYDPVAGGYEMTQAPAGQLDAWKGYWVRAVVEVDLIVPPTPMP